MREVKRKWYNVTMATQRIYKQEDFEQYLELRKFVFVGEQNVDPSLEYDEYDTLSRDDVFHFAYFKDGLLVGSLRAIKLSDRAVKIGRIATLSSHRFQGYGSRMLRDVEIYFHNIGYYEVILNSQISAINFYLRNGYDVVGEVFLEAGIPHQRMVKSI